MAKVGSLEVDLGLNSAKFIQNLDKATKSLDSNVAHMKRSMASIQGAATMVQGALAAWAGSAIISQIGETINAFKEAERATTSLGSALVATGRYSEQAMGGIKDMATEISRLTAIDDDDIVAATASLAQFARTLNPQELAKAEEALVGYAKVMKIDLNTAAMQLGKTISGATESIGRSGIKIKDVASESERLNQVLQATSVMFETAKGEANDTEGRLAQLDVSTGNLKETIGETILKSLDSSKAFNVMTKAIESLDDWLKQNQTTIQGTIRFFLQMGETAVQIGGVVYHALGALVSSFASILAGSIADAMNGIQWVVNKAIDGINMVKTATHNLTGMKVTLGNQWVMPGADFATSLKNDFGKSASEYLGKAGQGASDIWNGKSVFGFNSTSSMPRGGGLGASFQSAGGGSGKKAHHKKSEAEKELDQLKSKAKTLKEELRNPLEVYKAGVVEADKMLKHHLITLDEYQRKLEKLDMETNKLVKLNPALEDLTGSQRQRVNLLAPGSKSVGEALDEFMKPSKLAWDGIKDRWDQDMAQLKDAQSIFESVQTPAEKYTETLRHLQEQLDAGNITQDTFNRKVKEAKEDVITPILTPIEQYAETVKNLQAALNAGALDQEQFNRQVEVANKNFEDATNGMEDNVQQIESFISNFGQNFENTLFSAFQGAKVSFRDFVVSALEDLGRLIFKLTVTIPLANALSNAILGQQNAVTGARGGGFLSFLTGGLKLLGGALGGGFGLSGGSLGHRPILGPVATPLPKFAAGGPIGANQLSIVGEKGPELFLPKSSGNIIPNHQLRGMGNSQQGNVQVNNYVTVNGSSGTPEQNDDLVKKMQKELERTTRTVVVDELAKQNRPGGLNYRGPYK